MIILNIILLVLITNFIFANFTFGTNKKVFVHYLFLLLIFMFLFKKIIKIESYLAEDIRRKSYKSILETIIYLIVYLITIGGSIYLFYFLKDEYPFLLEYLVV